MLAATSLSVRRGRADVVTDLTLRLDEGRITALLGPNGSGKTSSMLAFLGLLPSRGSLERFGSQHHPDARARAAIGFVPQEGGIPTSATALEWVSLQAELRGASAATTARILDALQVPTHRRLARRLSGGERRRVALAAALVGNPRLLVLDEPTAGLDPELRAIAISLICEAARDGAAVLLSTHLLDEVVECADSIVIMRDGRIVRRGCLNELLGEEPISWSPASQAQTLRNLFGESQ